MLFIPFMEYPLNWKNEFLKEIPILFAFVVVVGFWLFHAFGKHDPCVFLLNGKIPPLLWKRIFHLIVRGVFLYKWKFCLSWMNSVNSRQQNYLANIITPMIGSYFFVDSPYKSIVESWLLLAVSSISTGNIQRP